MHGFVFSEIQRYVEDRYDRQTWYAILGEAGIGDKEYENFLEYEDVEAVSIVGAASKLTGLDAGAILQDFGSFLGRDLLRIFRPVSKPEWRTLDFLANVENSIHQVVRSRNAHAKPPALSCVRTGAHEVTISYRSPRKLCALAVGITHGVADAYEESVIIHHDACMHRGDPECLIRVVLDTTDTI